MADYRYPVGIYDRASNLLAALGSFWTNTFGGREQAADVAAARGQTEQQNVLTILDAAATISRYEVPIYQRENWFAWTLLESERNTQEAAAIRYDTGLSYDAGYTYDMTARPTAAAFPALADMGDVHVIMNRFANPSLVWFRGLDFDVVDDAIILRANPFTDTRVLKQNVYVGGVATDREAVLWMFRADFDWDTIYRQFGYVIGMKLQSSRGYRDLLNAVFDGLTGGTAKQQIATALSILTGIPLVQEPTETVEDIWVDTRSRLIVTDQHVYRFDRDAMVLVAEGDTVRAGDSMTDALQIYELNRGQVPDWLQALAMGRNLLVSCFYSDLVFENKVLPLTVITDDPSGFTKLTWPLGGFPADVDRFFDELHDRGVAESNKSADAPYAGPTVIYRGDECDTFTRTGRAGTMAHLLDRRAVRNGEPKAINLPTTINPLEFLIQNVLRNNAYIVRVKIGEMGADSLGLHNARFLQQIVPPHTAMILVVELDAGKETITGDKITDVLATFTAVEPLVDPIVGTAVRESFTARLVAGNCE